MNRWLWYVTGAYLVPSRLTSALITGLAIADIAYTVVGISPMTAVVVFKAAVGVKYLLI